MFLTTKADLTIATVAPILRALLGGSRLSWLPQQQPAGARTGPNGPEERKVLRYRHLVIALVIALVLAPLSVPRPAKADIMSFVTRQGTQLMVESQPYRFTGVNIYNANSNGDCSYAFDSSSLATSLNAINPSGGVIRAWFFQQLATPNGVRDWTAFDRTLSQARSHGFRLIATLIDQWGDCGSRTPGFGYKDENWYESGYMHVDPIGTESYRSWAAETASRYAADPTILAWELVNEPEVKPVKDGSCSTNAADILRSFAADVSAVIKGVDPNHLVSLGTGGGGQCGAQGDDYGYVHSPNTIDLCSYHDYTPNSVMPGDQFNGLQNRINQCTSLGKPVFIGEMGLRPVDVGDTLAAREQAFHLKFAAQMAAGVVGELMWAWNKDASTLNNFDIRPGDPALTVLGTGSPFSWVLDFAFSHDGKKIAATAVVNGVEGLYVMARDGSSAPTLLVTQQQGYLHGPDFSPDDQQILYIGAQNNEFGGVYVVSAIGGMPTRLTQPVVEEDAARWSPDGRKIISEGTTYGPDGNHQIRELDVSTVTDTVIADLLPGYATGVDYSVFSTRCSVPVMTVCPTP
jgi:hypothetical protein